MDSAKLDAILAISKRFTDEAVARMDAEFHEADHPRDPDGKFGSGGSGKSKAPFVNEFMKGSKNREQDLDRLSSMSDEKLKKALELLTKNNVNDDDAKYMKELIRDILKASK
jgi:hypothetical protein